MPEKCVQTFVQSCIFLYLKQKKTERRSAVSALCILLTAGSRLRHSRCPLRFFYFVHIKSSNSVFLFFPLPPSLSLLLLLIYYYFFEKQEAQTATTREPRQKNNHPGLLLLIYVLSFTLNWLDLQRLAVLLTFGFLLFAPSWHRPRTVCIYFAPHWFLMTRGCQGAWLCSCIWLPFLLHERRSLSEASSHWMEGEKNTSDSRRRTDAHWLVGRFCIQIWVTSDPGHDVPGSVAALLRCGSSLKNLN